MDPKEKETKKGQKSGSVTKKTEQNKKTGPDKMGTRSGKDKTETIKNK